METLKNSINKIKKIKQKVDSLDSSLFDHYVVSNKDITKETISVVMTASNRSKQTYFTLDSMLKNHFKDVHIVLVDDSTIDPTDLEVLKRYPYYIDLIVIKRENKNWVNPCVNYNIGFKFIKGETVVIQNAEVCHVGYVLDFIKEKIKRRRKYYVFDVKSVSSYEKNEDVYKSDLTDINIYNQPFYDRWYQHKNHINRKFHFLSAMSKKTFDDINGFSYDYTMGAFFDDDDFLLKIISKKIEIKCISNESTNVGGIHLFHQHADEGYCQHKLSNEDLFSHKKRIYEKTGQYIDYNKLYKLYKNIK